MSHCISTILQQKKCLKISAWIEIIHNQSLGFLRVTNKRAQVGPGERQRLIIEIREALSQAWIRMCREEEYPSMKSGWWWYDTRGRVTRQVCLERCGVNLNDQEGGGKLQNLLLVETWGCWDIWSQGKVCWYLVLPGVLPGVLRECSLVRGRTLGSWVRQEIKLLTWHETVLGCTIRLLTFGLSFSFLYLLEYNCFAMLF